MNSEETIVNVAEAIIELPIGYKAGGQDFYIYPPSLGTTILVDRAIKSYDLEEELSGLVNVIAAARKNKSLIVDILAICSFENRKDAMKTELLNKRKAAISKANVDNLIAPFLSYVTWVKEFDEFYKFFKLDVEHRYLKRVADVKSRDGGSLSFNGKSIYGTLIDVACERYGWTMDYVVWGISSTNLNMLISDHLVSMFLTKEERKKVVVPNDRSVINMDDKNVSVEQIMAIFGK